MCCFFSSLLIWGNIHFLIISMVNHLLYFRSGNFKAQYLTSIYLYFWNILPNILNLNSYFQITVSQLFIKKRHVTTITFLYRRLAYIRIVEKLIPNDHSINLECNSNNSLLGPYYSTAKVPFGGLGKLASKIHTKT